MSAIEIPSAPRGPDEGVRLFAFTVGYVNMPLTFFLAGEPGEIRAPVTAFLIDHPKGAVLFDTGLGPRFERPQGTAPESFIDLETGSTMDARLKAIGVQPEDIRWIICSHLHTDHAGGNCYFPNATIVVQAAEHEHAFNHVEGDQIYHKPEYDLGQPFLKVNGEHDLFGDGAVVVFPTLGHTPGHQSARVRTVGGDIVLAADCCNVKRSLDELRLPDHCHNADLYLDSLRLLSDMRNKGARIYFSHDPEFWDTIPQSAPII